MNSSRRIRRSITILFALPIAFVSIWKPTGLHAQQSPASTAARQKMEVQKERKDSIKRVALNVEGVVFQAPEAWKVVKPNSPMRKAQLEATDKSGKQKADILFFCFGPDQGGSVEANIKRWLSQFQEPIKNQKIISLPKHVSKVLTPETIVHITFVQAEGTFLAGMPGASTTPMENYGLYGAIIQRPKGNLFVKMTGPIELIKANHDDFYQMLQSAHIE